MKTTSFIKSWDVGNPGAGIVERSIVDNTMTRKQETNYQPPRTTIPLSAAKKKRAFGRKNTVQGGTPLTVRGAGKPKKFVRSIYQTGETSLGSFPVLVPVLSFFSFLPARHSKSSQRVSKYKLYSSRWNV